MLLQQLDIHIIQRGGPLTLGQLCFQRLQIGQVGNRLDCGAVAELLTTGTHVSGPLPIQAGTQRP